MTDGLEFSTGDLFDPAKLNKKTRFVGSGTQATNLITTPQTGQMVFCTSSDSTFTKDKISVYDGSWITPKYTESSQQSLGTAGNENASIASKVYNFVTLPTTEKFYIITGFQVKRDSTAGNVICGADIVDAIPPVSANTTQVATSNVRNLTSAGGTLEDFTVVASKAIPGGTNLGIWIMFDTNNSVRITISSRTVYKKVGYSATLDVNDNTAWTVSGSGTVGALTAVVYFRGYS